jgi:EmrB/QacA subfamily drug resistance transporter
VVIILGLLVGMFLGALDQTIVATALPRIASELHGVGHLSWVVSAYLLTATAATPIYGKLSDLYGRKLMLQIALVIFLVASVLCALAGTMGQLVAFRALQGLGGGGLLAMSHATIADIVSPRERGRYQGYFAAVFAAASVSGPVLGGFFVDHLTWRWVFWINLPLGLAALGIAQVALRRLRAKRVRHRIDYAGAVLVVSAICCVLLITTMGGKEIPWQSTVMAALAGAAVLLAGLAILQERRAPEPILAPRLFANPIYRSTCLINFGLSLTLLGATVYLPLFLQIVLGLAPGESGLMLIPLTSATVLGAMVSGQLVAKTGRYKIFPLIGSVATLIGFGLLSLMGSGTSLVLIGLAIFLGGLGVGMIMPVTLVAVQNAVEARDLGSATSSVSFFRSMGGSFGVALFGAVLMARLDHHIGIGSGLGPNPGVTVINAGTEALSLVSDQARPVLAAAAGAAFQDLFRIAAVASILTLIAVVRLEERPLRDTTGLEAREREARETAAASAGMAD